MRFRVLLPLLFYYVRAQCPKSENGTDLIVSPCQCVTTRYEPINIRCENAGNLQNVLNAIGQVPELIDSLEIVDTPIVELPANALPNLAIKRLLLRNNGLTTIHPLAFEPPLVHTLMELEIRHNSLGEVPQSGITALRALRTLVLTRNGINRVTDNAFSSYASAPLLARIDLSSNRLTQLPVDAFAGLTALRDVNLDKNFFTSVPTTALQRVRTLEDLSLGLNDIKELSTAALPFPALKALSLEGNDLEHIPRDAFQQTNNLLYLYIGINRFKAVDPQIFYFISQLKVLAMGHNKNIKRLDANTFQYVPNLVRVELPDCGIVAVEDGTFQRIPNVQLIDLSGNVIEKVTSLTYQSLRRLNSLKLSNNNISVVHDRAFSQLPALRQLDLSGNKLTTLESSTFWQSFESSTPPTSRSLQLYDNPWHCDARLAWLRQWLRDESSIMIDSSGHEPSQCATPSHLKGIQLRAHDPSTTPSSVTIVTATQEGLGVALGGFGVRAGKNSGGSMGIAAIILGIVLGIFCLSLLLLLIVRYFVSKNRREQKDFDDYHQFTSSSVASGYGAYVHGAGSSIGSAYPSTTEPTSLLRAQTVYAMGSRYNGNTLYTSDRSQAPNRAYFLNRPWYWWF